MDEFSIRVDQKALRNACNELRNTGKQLEGKLNTSPDTGGLSGMAGVERLITAYQSLQNAYRKLAQLAKKDADDIQTIANNFHKLDTSAKQ